MKTTHTPIITDIIEIKRSWRTRLFSWPWKPWVAVDMRTLKDGEVLTIDNTYIMNARTRDQLLKVTSLNGIT